MTYILEDITSGRSYVLVEKSTGEIVGCYRWAKEGEYPNITGIYVSINQRGKGLGKMLMKGFEEHTANVADGRYVLSWVSKTNTAARNLYRSCGYAEIAIEGDAKGDMFRKGFLNE